MGYNPISNDVGNEITNPGVSPAGPTPGVGPEKPGLGAGEESQGKPFSLGPEEGKAAPEAPPELPSPMEVAGDTARQQPQVTPPELSGTVTKLQNQLDNIHDKIADPVFSSRLTDDHFTAMQKVTQKMNPDMQTIAKYSNGQYTPAQQQHGQSVLEYVSNWINGAQGTLQGALSYLQTEQKPNPADYLRLQYAVQRASQRGELFASIVGSSVSGIKTIMSTQLG
jgi:hypothetical protein